MMLAIILEGCTHKAVEIGRMGLALLEDASSSTTVGLWDNLSYILNVGVYFQVVGGCGSNPAGQDFAPGSHIT